MECATLIACPCGTPLTGLAVEDGIVVCGECGWEITPNELEDHGLCSRCLILYAEVNSLVEAEGVRFCPFCGMIILG